MKSEESSAVSGGNVWSPPTEEADKRSAASAQINSLSQNHAQVFARIQSALDLAKAREERARRLSRNIRLIASFLLIGYGITSSLYAVLKGIPGINLSVHTSSDSTHFFMSNVSAANTLFVSFGLTSVGIGLVVFGTIFTEYALFGIILPAAVLVTTLSYGMSHFPDQATTLQYWVNSSLKTDNAVPSNYQLVDMNHNYLVHDIDNKPYQLLITRKSDGVKAVLNPIK